MDINSFVSTWFQEKLQSVATQLQDEQDKVALLQSQLEHQQIVLDNFSKEKHDTILKVNTFVDKIRANLEVNDENQNVDYWKKRFEANYSSGLQPYLEKLDSLDEAKVANSFKHVLEKKNQILEEKLSNLSRKLIISECETIVNVLPIDLAKKIQERPELFTQERNTLNDQINKLDAKVLEAESKELVLQLKISNLEEQLEQYSSSLKSKVVQDASSFSCFSSNSHHLYESTSISEKKVDDYMNSDDDVQTQCVFVFDDSYNVKDIGCFDESSSFSYLITCVIF